MIRHRTDLPPTSDLFWNWMKNPDSTITEHYNRIRILYSVTYSWKKQRLFQYLLIPTSLFAWESLKYRPSIWKSISANRQPVITWELLSVLSRQQVWPPIQQRFTTTCVSAATRWALNKFLDEGKRFTLWPDPKTENTCQFRNDGQVAEPTKKCSPPSTGRGVHKKDLTKEDRLVCNKCFWTSNFFSVSS